MGAIAVPEHKKQKKFIKPGESRDEKVRAGARAHAKLARARPRHKDPQQYMRVAPDADGKVRHHRKLSERVIPVHSLRLRVGALVEFEEGQHRGMWGRVTVLEEGQSVVRLNLNGTVRVQRSA